MTLSVDAVSSVTTCIFDAIEYANNGAEGEMGNLKLTEYRLCRGTGENEGCGESDPCCLAICLECIEPL
jgi:hypothetical protein